MFLLPSNGNLGLIDRSGTIIKLFSLEPFCSGLYAKMEVGQEFHSYEDFESAFKRICNANNWTFVKHDSKSVKVANKELKSDSQPYSAKFRYRYVRFRCKHGGSIRKRGKGLRPNQR